MEGDYSDPSLGALQERAAILNAYYVPPECEERLYPSITPINSCRLVFSCTLGEPLDLLEDRTYYGREIEEMVLFEALVDQLSE